MASNTETAVASKKGAVLAVPITPESTAIRSLEQYLEAAPKTSDALGDFMISVGTFEKAVGRSMESLAADFGTQGGIEAFVRSAPPEVVAKFLQVMVRSARVGRPDLSKMSADQKIETGSEMKELAKELRALFDALRASRAGVGPRP